MEQVNIQFNELIEGFGNWMKNVERTNVILYYILEDRAVVSFIYDFQFICEISLEELKHHYNNDTLTDEQTLLAFQNEYLEIKTISVKNIIKYII